MAFDQTTRNRLNRFVADSRALLSDEFTRQLQSIYGMNPISGEVADLDALSGLSPHQQETARLLRETFEHYLAGNDHEKGKSKEKQNRIAALDRIVREQAFTVLNRLAALRMSEARGFLTESLSKGYDSKGFQLFHRLAGNSLGETGESYIHYLFSIFDEFAPDLSVLFDRFSAQGRLFPTSPVLLELLDLINHEEIALLWAEDETIGWIYQYFNSQEERKKMRDASQAPRNSRELAVRNQFFTPRYVVEFLTDNTLGRIWYEMTKGQTKLVNNCKYLVKRPNAIFLNQGEEAPEQAPSEGLSQEELLKKTVYIEHRELKDPRNIKMLDPACGSMHFGLYCFDLFERIYDEAWDIELTDGTEAFVRENEQAPLTQTYSDKAEFLKHVPRLIIENNIHGVDIDPRALQVAGMSLWQRAHNSWQKADVKPQQRPQIIKSNMVCAEPMPGEKDFLQEFSSQLKPTVLGQLVEAIFEKMQLAGEAGTLLKIETEIKDAVARAKEVWHQQNQALSQFPDLAKVAKQCGKADFDVSDINDEGFWQQAEQKILDALALYASSISAEINEQKRLFASDAAKGFAFIDLCKKKFDVVLMNPPFGEPSKSAIKYINEKYVNYNKNILTAFIIRAIQQNSESVSIGAIYDKTILIKSSYEKFRRTYLTANNSLYAHIDLGWDVLDANVEVACSVIDTKNRHECIFFDVRDASPNNKEMKIASILNENYEKTEFKSTKLIFGNTFSNFPNSVIGHDFPLFVIDSFRRMRKFNEFTTCFEGHTLKSERYFRFWWETSLETIFDGNSKYQRLYNGGPYQKFVSPLHEVLYTGKNKEIALADNSSVFRNSQLQGEGLVGFGKRGTFIDAHVVPKEFISTVEGKHVIINEDVSPYVILAFINSQIFQFIINLYCGQHKYPGYVGILPVPDFICSSLMEEAGELCEKIYKKVSYLQNCEEISSSFNLNNLAAYWDYDAVNIIETTIEEINSLEERMNDLIIANYNASENELKLVKKFNVDTPKQVGWWNKPNETIIPMKLSVIAGCIFHRWESAHKKRRNDVFKPILNNPIIREKKLDFYNYLLVSGEINIEFNQSLKNTYNELNQKLGGNASYEDFSIEVFDNYKLNNLAEYFCNHKLFFDKHLTQYNNRPIYWPLQSSNGSFTLIVYYPDLTNQTLLKCNNDVIQPKLDEYIKAIDSLKFKSSRTAKEEKELEVYLNKASEISQFRDEILRLSKSWIFNFDDGIQISAAPLWRLFQHKPWQKKLKQTWEKLKEGEYDWAHLAFSTWPERVLKKCHANRSLAIAHDVEDDLWHEVEVIRGKKKELVWEWQPKPLSESELRAYIKEKIATDDRLKLYRSNQSNNAKGGAW